MELKEIFDKNVFQQFVLVNALRLLSHEEITDLAFSLYTRCDQDKFHEFQHQEILQELRDRQAMRKEIFN